MIYGIYAIKDAKSTFMPCNVDINDQCAIRNFEHAVMSPGSLLASHPNDYSLCRLATFDNETGQIEPEASYVLLTDAASVLRKE